MSIAAMLLPEFDLEMATTRKVIARVPSEKGDWKPHPKSFSLAHLTQLVATMPGWITNMATTTELDLARSAGYSNQTTDTLLATFDRVVAEARSALEKSSDADLAVPWSLKREGTVLFTSPRGVTIRQTVNHIIHHRGQLTVYLRLVDVPVPSIYGPTADEPW